MRTLGEERVSGQLRRRGAGKGAQGSVVGGSHEGALQVVFGIGMETRKLRTGQTENGFHLRCGSATQEQFLGDPQVRDIPISMRKTLGNVEMVQPSLVN